ITGHFRRAVRQDHLHVLDAHAFADQHHGDTILSNMIMLGHARQLGAVPVSAEAIGRAIVLNGVAVEANLHAFRLGRLSARNPAALLAASTAVQTVDPAHESLDQQMQRHVAALTAYQNAAYALRYSKAIERI